MGFETMISAMSVQCAINRVYGATQLEGSRPLICWAQRERTEERNKCTIGLLIPSTASGFDSPFVAEKMLPFFDILGNTICFFISLFFLD